jgi:hypothetical protein
MWWESSESDRSSFNSTVERESNSWRVVVDTIKLIWSYSYTISWFLVNTLFYLREHKIVEKYEFETIEWGMRYWLKNIIRNRC